MSLFLFFFRAHRALFTKIGTNLVLFFHILPENHYFYIINDAHFMKLLTKSQIRELDKRTIEEENIPSIELMERAATALADAIKQMFPEKRTYKVFAGPGNNGGDALAVARMLAHEGNKVEVYLFNTRGQLSDDCQVNAEKLIDCEGVLFSEITSHFAPGPLLKSDVVIDGLFGSGLSKPLDGGYAAVVKYINDSPATVVSIDIPSGLMCEDNTYNSGSNIICADTTLSLQLPKLAFFFAENQRFIGEWFCLDIRLSERVMRETHSDFYVSTIDTIRPLLKQRNEFAHKGVYGHALLVAGSYGMAGASILAACACMRSGVGLLTLHAPKINIPILQTSVPEAIVRPDDDEHKFTSVPDVSAYQAVAVGPGIGRDDLTAGALFNLLQQSQHPLVIDADALNILSANREWLSLVPRGSILTPHPKEFERLVGHCESGYEQLVQAQRLARNLASTIVLKGAWSLVVTPEGTCYFNPTGNPGMATAGSGDVLTGIILALLAQGYTPSNAARIAVYVHGTSGDIAAEKIGEQSLIASDIIHHLPQAWKLVRRSDYLGGNKELKCY